MLRHLLAAGALPDRWDGAGYPPLHRAERRTGVDLVLALLAAGADPNRKHIHNKPALHWAADHGNGVVLSYLLAAGANPNGKNNYGDTALHEAAGYGSADGVAQLLAAGAALNLQGLDGETALHWAVFWGFEEVVALLLQGGAKVDIKNDDGDTAIDVARAAEFSRILALLEAAADAVPQQQPDLPADPAWFHILFPGHRQDGVAAMVERPLYGPRGYGAAYITCLLSVIEGTFDVWVGHTAGTGDDRRVWVSGCQDRYGGGKRSVVMSTQAEPLSSFLIRQAKQNPPLRADIPGKHPAPPDDINTGSSQQDREDTLL